MTKASNIAPSCPTTSTGPSGRAFWEHMCGETSTVSTTTTTYRDTSANVSAKVTPNNVPLIG